MLKMNGTTESGFEMNWQRRNVNLAYETAQSVSTTNSADAVVAVSADAAVDDTYVVVAAVLDDAIDVADAADLAHLLLLMFILLRLILFLLLLPQEMHAVSHLSRFAH